MTKEKQIEEMAVEFAKINCNPKGCYGCDLCDEYGSLELNCEDYLYYRNSMAETFYNAGYRKASDVAREVIDEFERRLYSVSHRETPITGFSYSVVDIDEIAYAAEQLKKKYTEEGKCQEY